MRMFPHEINEKFKADCSAFWNRSLINTNFLKIRKKKKDSQEVGRILDLLSEYSVSLKNDFEREIDRVIDR